MRASYRNEAAELVAEVASWLGLDPDELDPAGKAGAITLVDKFVARLCEEAFFDGRDEAFVEGRYR